MYRKDELRTRILLTASLVILSLIVLLLILRFRDNTLADFTYITNKQGEIIIEGYSGDPSALTVPAKIEGKPVVAIGKNAFTGHRRLRSVELADSIRTVDEAAFADCKNLKEVEAPGVTHVEIEAFQGCAMLKKITLSDKLAVIADRAFQGCARLQSLKAPASLAEIGTDALSGCENLALDVSENQMAADLAIELSIPTTLADTSRGMWLKIGGATLLLGAFVGIVWWIVGRARRDRKIG